MPQFTRRSGAFLSLALTAAAFTVLTACQSTASSGSPESAKSAAAPTQLVSAPAPKALPANPDGQRLFYATHSLMWDVPDPLTEEVKAFGIKDHVVVGIQRMGFSTTKQQWDQGQQAKAALQTGKIDDFIMSPMDMPDTGVENFVMLGIQNNPGMRFFVQNNWAGFNQDGQKARTSGMASMGRVNWDSSTEEQLKTLNTECEKAFEAQVRQINEKIGHPVLFIIPTSQANTTLRTAIVRKEFPGLDKQSQLFLDQIGHPTPPLVTLNVYIHFATIYGRSPVGLPIPAYLKRANNPKFDEDFNTRLEQLAWKTVTEYSFSGVKTPAAK